MNWGGRVNSENNTRLRRPGGVCFISFIAASAAAALDSRPVRMLLRFCARGTPRVVPKVHRATRVAGSHTSGRSGAIVLQPCASAQPFLSSRLFASAGRTTEAAPPSGGHNHGDDREQRRRIRRMNPARRAAAVDDAEAAAAAERVTAVADRVVGVDRSGLYDLPKVSVPLTGGTGSGASTAAGAPSGNSSQLVQDLRALVSHPVLATPHVFLASALLAVFPCARSPCVAPSRLQTS